ncbi:S-adenosyl-L-methionine-dependent methyltransferase [Mycena pura]|uniref:S-adenosyl-L-methionine-dependent methyltransferase n=1 Tax=Mycena pura TaxID=153505 RepID=A0AAD6Y941_9AGAR|nr:S-adenosyl-L-methionine-dependent methyltransferase [Mycena pura]
MASPDYFPTLRRLASTITESLDAMEAVFARAQTPFPSPDMTFDPAHQSEILQRDPEVAGAVLNIVAATAQLSAAVSTPGISLWNASNAFIVSACLRVAAELNVAELLRDAGPSGLHANDLASPSKADARLLARIMRLLATHQIFREVRPNVFANNRISSFLDKGKPTKALFDNRETRLTGSEGFGGFVELFSDDSYKSAGYLAETILEPRHGVRDLPYTRAFNTHELFYYWLERPENAYRRERFGIGMRQSLTMEAPDAIFQGFDWGLLPEGAILVDVGGGNGHVSMQIAQGNPQLHVVVQDLEHAVDGARQHWEEGFPSAIREGKVTFQGHDFFTPQPIKDAAVFLLRWIVHNWPDDRVVEFLQHLRASAQPTTRLVVIENVLSVACPPAASSDAEAERAIPGAARPKAPEPLLPNWGVGTAGAYYWDLIVHCWHGGVERTLSEFIDVLGRGGWKLARVYHSSKTVFSHLEAVPV